MEKSYYRYRTSLALFLLALLVALSADAATITVASTADAGGSCPGASCTLRQAIATAGSGDTITFSLPANSAITLTSAELLINKSLTIKGPGANLLTVQRSSAGGTPAFRIFDINPSSVNATISGLTVSNGIVNGTVFNNNTGGGIFNLGTLTLSNTTISGNSATNGGGGIINSGAGTMTIISSTISGNSAFNGGGIVTTSTGTMAVINTTISGNSATGSGGGILNDGTSAVTTTTNTTISGNSATNGGGGGVYNNSGTVNVRNTLIALNTAAPGPDFLGRLTSQGYNLIGNTSGTTITGTTTGNQLNGDPVLGPLQNNGGPTFTHALLSGSTAREGGNSSGFNTDQRGFARPVDSPTIPNATGGDGSDIGAYEVQADQLPGCSNINRIVNNNSDSGTDSLRAVIANVCAGSTITFAPNVQGAITLSSTELIINKSLTINGPGANLLSVQRSAAGGTPAFRIFHVIPASVIATISGLTISNGNLNGGAFPGNSGGGILNEESTLTLSNCALSGNNAVLGGALLNLRGNLTLANCTLNQNSASGSGGAILNAGYNGVATLTLTNCTLNQNQAGQYGGAIYNDGTSSGNASLTLTNCTLNQNTAALGASGIYNDALNPGSSGVANLRLQNTILRAGASGANLVNDSGTIVSGGHNLSSDAAGGPAGTAPGGFLNATGDKRNTDPQLDPAGLANNGGPTMTIALQATSPAINGGDNNLSPLTDQRNYTRSGVSDIGSFEFGGTFPPTLIPVCVSRKLHGSFVGDIPLPRSGALGVECRTGGASGIHQVIMTFPGTVTVTAASVTTGVGSVSSFSVSGPEVTVNLTGVSNAQKIAIRLFGVSDGTYTNDVDVPMGVLLGDTSGNGAVTATDVSQIKLQSGQPATAANFREDVTVSGSINASDVSSVKLKSGTALP